MGGAIKHPKQDFVQHSIEYERTRLQRATYFKRKAPCVSKV